MVHRLKAPAGRATYAPRKRTVEPVFGIIKSVMGFRQFLPRGRDNVQNEWTLVCLAWNLKRMAALRAQSEKREGNDTFCPKCLSFVQQTALRASIREGQVRQAARKTPLRATRENPRRARSPA